MSWLLDTDIVSYHLRGERGVPERVARVPQEELAISAVSIGEIWVVAHSSPPGKIDPLTVAQLQRAVTVLPVDDATWRLFGRTKAVLAEQHRPIGLAGNFDVLIACTAAMADRTVVTHNRRHFDRLADVLGFEIEDWADNEPGAS